MAAKLTTAYDDDWIVVCAERSHGFANRLRRSRRGARGGVPAPGGPLIDRVADDDPALTFALAEVRMLADRRPDDVRVEDDCLHLGHCVAACLDGEAAEALGLPPLVDLTFRTDVKGALGTESFRLHHEWTKFGRRHHPKRVGAILRTEDGDRRLPLWLLEAVELAEGFTRGTDLAAPFGRRWPGSGAPWIRASSSPARRWPPACR